MAAIAHDKALDSTPALLRDGYKFISKRCRRFQSNAFETRLALRKVVCTMGEDAAREFYVPGRFTRREAMPKTTLKLLQDEGSVQLQDGDAHRRRKQMMLSFMTPGAAERLGEAFAAEMQAVVSRRQEMQLLSAAEEALCRAVCRWAGVPLSDEEVPPRTRELHAMIDGAGSIGPRNWKGHLLRRQTEQWAREVVRNAREGKIDPPAGSALASIAEFRDADGEPLDLDVAAVELINVLRPTVAVAYYITFGGLALHQHPTYRPKIRQDEELLEAFVHEVRRFYPFFPFVAGRVREEYAWKGRTFEEGEMVLLDLYGTNRDPRSWQDPDRFVPERFRGWDGNAFALIPQGGGDHVSNHRCAGEWLTIELMKAALRVLASMSYEVPRQNLEISLSRMPTFPRSGFVMRDVRATT